LFFYSRLVIPDFKSLDDDVTLAGDVEQAKFIVGDSEASSVYGGRLSGVVLKRDVACCCRSGNRDIDRLVINAAKHKHAVSRRDVTRRVLNVAPSGGGAEAGVGVAAGG